MDKLLSALFVLVLFVSAVVAQVTGVEDLQNGLTKSLIRNAPLVRDVRFSGCSATIKVSKPGSIFISSGGSYVGAAFPHDDSTGYLSGGSGNTVRNEYSSERFVIDMSALIPDNVSVSPTYRNMNSLIEISGRENAIGVLKKGKVVERPKFAVVLSKKSGAKTAALFRDLISRCN